MFIKSLTIKNFRCFGKGTDEKGTTINFNGGLTAFIGRNGSGKTTILEALNFLIGSDYLPTRISEKDFNSDAKEIKDEIVIEGETEKPFFATLDVRSTTNQLETIIIPCNKIKLTIKRREKPEKVLDDPFVISKYVLPIVGEIDGSIFEKDEKVRKASRISQIKEGYTVFFKLKDGQERNAKVISYQLTYNPNRLTKCPKSYYLSKDRDDDVSGNYSLIAKILTDLHWKYKKKQTGGENTISSEYDTLARSLRGIVDEKSVLINGINEKVKAICCDDKNFQIDFIDTDQPYKSAFISKKEGEKLLLPDNLGSGFNILIAYALFAYVAEQEKIPIVLIIDEPELHLHSDWQKKMYDIFSNQTNLQFVYSTQSENFISLKNWKQIRSISDFQVFPKEEILQEQITATDGKNGRRSSYLDDYAAKNLHISAILRENLELFFAKKCVLVEGPSEKYGLPKLLKLSGCDVENFSVSIIPAWGKTKIKNYQMICKVFGIDYYTIFDADIEGKDDSKIEQQNKKQNDKENKAIRSNAKNDKFTEFSTSFEARLGVTGDNKFQKLVKKIDELSDKNSLDQEIKNCLSNLKTFIES